MHTACVDSVRNDTLDSNSWLSRVSQSIWKLSRHLLRCNVMKKHVIFLHDYPTRSVNLGFIIWQLAILTEPLKQRQIISYQSRDWAVRQSKTQSLQPTQMWKKIKFWTLHFSYVWFSERNKKNFFRQIKRFNELLVHLFKCLLEFYSQEMCLKENHRHFPTPDHTTLLWIDQLKHTSHYPPHSADIAFLSKNLLTFF